MRRQAFNYAVDKNAIIRRLLQGQGTAMGTPIPKVAFGYNPAGGAVPVRTKQGPNPPASGWRVERLSIGIGLPLGAAGLAGFTTPHSRSRAVSSEVGVKPDASRSS